MPRKKSEASKAREANGNLHPKDVIVFKKSVLDFDDSGSDSEVEQTDGIVINKSKKRKASEDIQDSDEPALKINEEYARRFEHNKKREELHRLEEKYGKSSGSKRRKTDGSESDPLASDESSSDEDEDEMGVLVTNDIDAQIQATIAAIRSKDPRVYDVESKFYREPAEDQGDANEGLEEKSMTLKQYHQKNILEGYTGAEEEDADAPPRTYVEEQEYLKRTVVGEMHAAVEGSDDEDGFLIRKEKPMETDEETTAVALPENPDQDPEGFLDAFFSTKAWLPKGTTEDVPFESEDEDEEFEREEFEHAYNLRFEDPSLASRSKIVTHARDVANKMSLRREETSRRKKARDEKKERQLREQEEREAEKKRLKKLRVEELEKKLKMVKEAGGLDGEEDGSEVVEDKWKKFLDDAWEGDEAWEKKMSELYGDKYYEQKEDLKGNKKSGKPKKPTWDDDIDINDIIPDFKETESISDSEDGGVSLEEPETVDAPVPPQKALKGPKKDKRVDRALRAQIESYVDDKLPLSISGSSKQSGTTFRYREVTPESFGLAPTDILFAGDKQLNTYAGLKKLASFRDDAKKAKDRKRYAKGKGYKLREWRKEVFGKPEVDWTEKIGDVDKSKHSKNEKTEEHMNKPTEKTKKKRRKSKANKEATIEA